jgi:hypothetical protein
MSLHNLAHHVQKAGRGEDTVLIHMTPGEVKGLQSLAMAHGGSLTINPETGLPEASFLKNILPMIAGFALAPLTAGTSLAFLGATPLASALTVGAATGLATGSLNKGLMAGLGAFGGASLGTALSATGAAAAGAGSAATPAAANTIASSTPNLGGSLMAGASGTTSAVPSSVLGSGFYSTAPNIVTPPLSTAMAPTQLTAAKQIIPATSFNTVATGAKNALSDPIAFAKANPLTTAGVGLGLYGAMQPEFKTQKQNQGMIRPYEFSRTQNMEAYDQGNPIYADDPGSSRERNYFTDQYTALKPYAAPGPEYKKAADGGLMGLNAFAVGGPVEEMSAQNAIGANQMYPQSQLQTPMYANPMVQRPVANDVVNQGVDAPVDPYTGEPRFAKGGTTGEYKYDYNPQTQEFTQTAAPKPKPTLLSGFRGNNFGINARAGRWDESLRDSPGLIGQLYRKQNPEPVQQAPIVTGGMPQAPQAQQMAQQPMYQPQQAAPIPAYQSPEQQLGLGGFYDYMNQQLGQMQQGQGYAGGGNVGGEYNLGGYSDGGRLLKGPGDGVSDSIPAVIGNRQPARLADGEFVVPARIVSELGNGSTEAGARKLYAMMDRVQKARRKSIGKGKVAANTRSEKFLPA